MILNGFDASFLSSPQTTEFNPPPSPTDIHLPRTRADVNAGGVGEDDGPPIQQVAVEFQLL